MGNENKKQTLHLMRGKLVNLSFVNFNLEAEELRRMKTKIEDKSHILANNLLRSLCIVELAFAFQGVSGGFVRSLSA